MSLLDMTLLLPASKALGVVAAASYASVQSGVAYPLAATATLSCYTGMTNSIAGMQLDDNVGMTIRYLPLVLAGYFWFTNAVTLMGLLYMWGGAYAAYYIAMQLFINLI